MNDLDVYRGPPSLSETFCGTSTRRTIYTIHRCSGQKRQRHRTSIGRFECTYPPPRSVTWPRPLSRRRLLPRLLPVVSLT